MNLEELQIEFTNLQEKYKTLKQEKEQMKTDFETQKTEFENKLETSKNDIESLRSTNMDLFLKVQTQYEVKEPVDEKEEESISFDDVLESL